MLKRLAEIAFAMDQLFGWITSHDLRYRKDVQRQQVALDQEGLQ